MIKLCVFLQLQHGRINRRKTYVVARRDKIGPMDHVCVHARLYSVHSGEECRPFAVTDAVSSDANEGSRYSATRQVRRFS